MKCISTAGAMVIAGLCALSSGLTSTAHATHRCVDYGMKPINLYVNGKQVEELVSESIESFNFTSFLERLGITELTPAQLAVLLQEINKDPTQSNYTHPIPNALKGIGGLSTTLLLQRIVSTDGSFVGKNGKPIANKILYGKIRDYTFYETKRGHINVDTCTDDLETGKRELFHWDIEVSGQDTAGFTVKIRDDNKPNDPFSLLPFKMPAEALNRNNRHSIWHRGLDHKLGAKGNSIKVRHVFHRELSTAIRQQLVRLPNTHPFYASSPESCIDLFTPGYPPGTFIELDGNDYCLGRCAHPAIYNSGD